MNLLRQADIISDEQLSLPIHIVGCGGIGSMAALALAKMGCQQIFLYDDDSLQDHNIPNQFYRLSDVGREKVDALASIIRDFSDASVTPISERVTMRQFRGIVICAVDSMKTRIEIWRSSIRLKPQVKLFIDGRMGAEVCRIYSIIPIDPQEVRFYERTLYSDEEAEDTPCTYRAIVYNTMMIGALIANQVKKYTVCETYPHELTFDLKTLTLITSST